MQRSADRRTNGSHSLCESPYYAPSIGFIIDVASTLSPCFPGEIDLAHARIPHIKFTDLLMTIPNSSIIGRLHALVRTCGE